MYTTAIVVYRGTGTGSTISFAPFFPISGAFYYFELKGTISDTVGVIRVRVDGADLINDTGLDTRNGGTGVINRIFFGEESGNTFPQFKVDDFVLLDTVDSGVPSNPANDFIGDVRVATIYPNGNGNSSQLVGQDADSTNNYLNVDEGTPDDDTTYNESNVINNQDTYTYQDLPTVTGTVFCVTPIPYVRKNDAGIRKVKTVVRLSAVETVGTEITLSTTYLYFMDIRHADPSGNQWTIANVNALEAGLKVTA